MTPRLSITIGVVAALSSPGAAWACRCKPRPQAAYVGYADAVVVGRVQRIAEGAQHKRYRINVAEGWKAKLPAGAVIISLRSDCEAGLEAGRDYLLYLRRTPAGYETGTCSGNLPRSEAGAAVAAIRRRYR